MVPEALLASAVFFCISHVASFGLKQEESRQRGAICRGGLGRFEVSRCNTGPQAVPSPGYQGRRMRRDEEGVIALSEPQFPLQRDGLWVLRPHLD